MKKYYLIAILILLAGLFAFHFYAAAEAERQIHEALELQSKKADSDLSVQYSSVEVSSFSGNIEFKDLTVVRQSQIQRSSAALFDLSYLDFLSIYFGGLEYGLRHLSNGKLKLSHPSYIDRSSLREIKFDTLNVMYSGNVLDGIRSSMTGSPLQKNHNFSFSGTGFRYNRPNSEVGVFQADSVEVENSLPPHSQSLWSDGKHDFLFRNVTWTPPASFQKKYSFFIRGFGYQPDAIPAERVSLAFSFNPDLNEIQLSEGSVSTNLCDVIMSGVIRTDRNDFLSSRLQKTSVIISNFSERFEQVLNNMKQLMGIKLPENDNKITFRIEGTLKNPRIAL